ncbi:hypothetical protein H1S01_19715 [Heliobacterium chlorum]|uniref:SHOCT domain-containing protein n=1 Tax=Heliobacterium chlorum TaxID=2698 RepID=A0ABR7T8P9_HELCL|nr:hypothetical protein [Heliobacterium chlorum]MBC9786672.1 hypothetical protein [Heliobacterium chlorum]
MLEVLYMSLIFAIVVSLLLVIVAGVVFASDTTHYKIALKRFGKGEISFGEYQLLRRNIANLPSRNHAIR